MSGLGSERHDHAVELVERLPTADEYVELLRRVGWTSPPGGGLRSCPRWEPHGDLRGGRAQGGRWHGTACRRRPDVLLRGRCRCRSGCPKTGDRPGNHGRPGGTRDATTARCSARPRGGARRGAFLPATRVQPASQRLDEKASLASQARGKAPEGCRGGAYPYKPFKTTGTRRAEGDRRGSRATQPSSRRTCEPSA
jgi:hypothetical protein